MIPLVRLPLELRVIVEGRPRHDVTSHQSALLRRSGSQRGHLLRSSGAPNPLSQVLLLPFPGLTLLDRVRDGHALTRH